MGRSDTRDRTASPENFGAFKGPPGPLQGMTVVAVLVDPPREGLVLPELAATSPLTEAETAEFYAAMVKDSIRAVDRSGGELLVNFRAEDDVPEEFGGDQPAEAEIRALVADALGETGDVRFEKQVGSTFAARAGNTVTHLLRDEEEQSAAVVRGDTPLLTRPTIDSAAMKLRTSEVVLGPAPEGRVYYAAFADAIDFADAFATPEIQTLTERASDAGHSVDYVPMQPVVQRGADLLTLLPLLESRIEAQRIVPEFTATFLRERGIRTVVDDDDGRQSLVRD